MAALPSPEEDEVLTAAPPKRNPVKRVSAVDELPGLLFWVQRGMRFLKSVSLFGLSVATFTIPFFDFIGIKNAVPFVVQMLLGWALFFSSVYQLVQGVRETIAGAKAR